MTQLLVDDEITRPIRESIDKWAGDAPEFSFKDRVAYIPTCAACTSIWATGLVIGLSRFRLGRLANGILAGSGAALIVDGAVKRLTGENG